MSRRLIFLFLFISSATSGQHSVRVDYNDSYEVKDFPISIKAEDFSRIAGTKRTLLISGSSYKITNNGTIKRNTILYKGGKENKIYYYGELTDTIYWIDANKDTSSLVFQPKIAQTEDSVMGLP
jgi:hypothetical protein